MKRVRESIRTDIRKFQMVIKSLGKYSSTTWVVFPQSEIQSTVKSLMYKDGNKLGRRKTLLYSSILESNLSDAFGDNKKIFDRLLAGESVDDLVLSESEFDDIIKSKKEDSQSNGRDLLSKMKDSVEEKISEFDYEKPYKVLIIEDGTSKYEAIANYILKTIPNAVISREWYAVDGITRLVEEKFDYIVVDMYMSLRQNSGIDTTAGYYVLSYINRHSELEYARTTSKITVCSSENTVGVTMSEKYPEYGFICFSNAYDLVDDFKQFIVGE